MSFKVRKTLVIGLGGTGRDAVLHAKRSCQEVYGEVPPTTRFIVFDTTSADDLRLGDGSVTLDRGEFRHLTVHNPQTLIRFNKHINAWFPADVPLRAVNAGAKQIRALGRLALHANTDVRDILNNLVSEINKWEVLRAAKNYELVDEGRSLHVSIVSSLAGGTGSGMLLDFAFLLRACPHLRPTDHITAYLLAPGVFAGRPATQNVESNTYAALREIDHHMNLRQISGTPETIPFGDEAIPLDQAPFDFVYFVNNVTSAGTVYKRITHLTEFLGRGIFMSIGASGKKSGDVWDNLRDQLMDQKKWHGKTPHYSSFGFSELVYDPEPAVRRYNLESANALVRALFLGEQSDAGDAVEDFMQANQLREEDSHDEVINALVPHAMPRNYPVPAEFDKKSVGKMLSRAVSFRRTEESNVRKESTENREEKSAEVSANLEDLVRDRVHAANGVAWCSGFLRALRGRVAGCQDEMRAEQQQLSDDIANEERLLGELRRECDDLRDGWFRAKKWEDLASRIQRTVRRCAQLEIERVRRAQADLLFGELIGQIDKEIERVDRLRALGDTLIEKIERDLENLRAESRHSQPFAKVFSPGTLTGAAKVSVEDFLKWLSEGRRPTVLDMSDRRASWLEQLLLDFASSQPSVRAAMEDSIEAVLRRMPRAERFGHIRELGKMAEPLWAYDRAHVVGGRRTTLLYLIGTGTETDSAFADPELVKHIDPGPTDPDVVTTGDRRRITCLKIEAAIPAFVLDGVERWRASFQDSDRPFSFHTTDAYNNVDDLLPRSDTDMNRKWWALALAFGIVEKRGDFYYFRSEARGRKIEDFQVKLAQGRAAAMKTFLNDAEMVDETQKYVDKEIRGMGVNEVAANLRLWVDGKVEEYRGRRMNAEIRELIETELEDVDNYVAESLERIE